MRIDTPPWVPAGVLLIACTVLGSPAQADSDVRKANRAVQSTLDAWASASALFERCEIRWATATSWAKSGKWMRVGVKACRGDGERRQLEGCALTAREIEGASDVFPAPPGAGQRTDPAYWEDVGRRVRTAKPSAWYCTFDGTRVTTYRPEQRTGSRIAYVGHRLASGRTFLTRPMFVAPMFLRSQSSGESTARFALGHWFAGRTTQWGDTAILVARSADSRHGTLYLFDAENRSVPRDSLSVHAGCAMSEFSGRVAEFESRASLCGSDEVWSHWEVLSWQDSDDSARPRWPRVIRSVSTPDRWPRVRAGRFESTVQVSYLFSVRPVLETERIALVPPEVAAHTYRVTDLLRRTEVIHHPDGRSEEVETTWNNQLFDVAREGQRIVRTPGWWHLLRWLFVGVVVWGGACLCGALGRRKARDASAVRPR